MALNEETEVSLMAKLEEVPKEAAESSSSSASASTSSSQVPFIPTPTDSLSTLDSLIVDLYNALNGKSLAEKLNTDLRDQLKECHQKIKELTIFEEKLKDQVSVNQLLCIGCEQAIAEREQALAELRAEKNTIRGWCDASITVDNIIQSQRPRRVKNCIGFSQLPQLFCTSTRQHRLRSL